MKIIAKKDFTINNKFYFVGDEIKAEEFEIEKIVKMNEQGFIEPLSIKEILSLKKEYKEEE